MYSLRQDSTTVGTALDDASMTNLLKPYPRAALGFRDLSLGCNDELHVFQAGTKSLWVTSKRSDEMLDHFAEYEEPALSWYSCF